MEKKSSRKKQNKSQTKKKPNININKTLIGVASIVLIIGIFLLIPKNNNNNPVIDNKEGQNVENNGNSLNDESFGDISIENELENQKSSQELTTGINKYLEFLWMVDGAFNKSRFNNQDFEVNGQKLSGNPSFTCLYQDNKNSCISTNFEENFHKLFANNIKMDLVYGDGVALRWYKKTDDGYIFTNSNNCNIGRMNTKQSLILKEKNTNELKFRVYYEEKIADGIFKGDHVFDEEFVLVKQDNQWKVSKAYYHDPCYMEYIIK